MSRTPPASIDRRAARRARARALTRGTTHSALAAEVAARMDERLDLVKIEPRRLLDAGCGTGNAASRLHARYPGCRIVAVDEVEAELAQTVALSAGAGGFARLLTRLGLGGRRAPLALAGELDRLPLAGASVDLVWSNLALHRHSDPLPAIREMHRVLANEGLLMFSTLGPDTLKELRRAFAEADPGRAHVHDFVDMHDLGDMLIASGFAAPVMDMETLVLTYDNVMELARDLRAAGAVNTLQSRHRGLGGRGMWERLRAACVPLQVQGRLPASFEIVYGHAWKPRPAAKPAPHVVKFHAAAESPANRK